ncbi:lipoprotein [Endozoicomonas sp. SCSIO W0465]|uniref:LPS translocon maturation chaperone LptM n=1 Tax=Endozoicomonas sp. SCSIO W0465 TaxID=2918516 RepID=UPI002075CF8D|nr:lipoprotein [Endozoicomonas sp. SCSIO W0465]USE37178.1 lipoprotein [Endozoicomonas sp. SCSIO W0465]
MSVFTAGHQLKTSAFAAAALLVLLLTGCGQKGDLYQPTSSLVSTDAQTRLVEKGFK